MPKKQPSVSEALRALIASIRDTGVEAGWAKEIKVAEQALARQKKSAKSAAAASAASGKSGRKGLPEETRAAIRESAGTLAETAVAFTVSEMTVRRIWKLAGRSTV